MNSPKIQFVLYGTFVASIALAFNVTTLAQASEKLGPSVEEVAPGVWRVRFGKPEELTPAKFREHQPRLEAIAALEKAERMPIDPANIGFSSGERGAALEIPMEADERFYGLGMNLRVFQLSGKKIVRVSDNQTGTLGDSHAPAPMYVSSRGYAVYVDTARYASFYFGNLNAVSDAKPMDAANGGKIADSVEELYRPRGLGSKFVGVDVPVARGVDLYIIAGPDMRQAVQRYNLFAGGGPLPPMWSKSTAIEKPQKNAAMRNAVTGLDFRKELKNQSPTPHSLGTIPQILGSWEVVPGKLFRFYLVKSPRLSPVFSVYQTERGGECATSRSTRTLPPRWERKQSTVPMRPTRD